jgi:hypothetical protein
MNTRLSTDLLDAIDGATESRGRDSQITEWAARAERLERALERPEVACRCGWQGKVSELIPVSDFEHGCPTCNAEFKPVGATNWYPL